MHCEQAKSLIDAYLDGDLAPTLANELSAHCMQCPDCRQTLALSEVAGHLVSADSDSVALDDEFTDRLMACIDLPGDSRAARLWRIARIGVPVAAAAVVGFALLGLFDPEQRVAGEKEFAPPSSAMSIEAETLPADEPVAESTGATAPAQPVRWQSLPHALELLLAPPRSAGGDPRPASSTLSTSAIEAGVEDL